MARQKFTLVLLLAGVGFGCTGAINDPLGSRTGSGPSGGTSGTGANGNGTGNGAGNGAPGTVIPPGGGVLAPGGNSSSSGSGSSGAAADPNAAGEMPLRRLTRREYNNTVRDLLGDTSNPADAFPLDRESDFLYRRAGLVSAQDLDTIRDAAQAVAKGVEAKVQMIAPCAAGGNETMCAQKFVTDFGLRAFRRPVSSEESARLMELYQAGRGTLMLSYGAAISLLVEGMLQSPSFLYHWEQGNSTPVVEGKVIRLNAYEQASRLSYLLWGSMPDQALFDAAAGNKLGTASELEAQARRMLMDSKARDTVAAFADEWLNLDQIGERPKDPAVYPEFKDDLKAAMAGELKEFIAGVMADDARLGTMLTTTKTYLNGPLAAVYGIGGVQGTAMKPMMLDSAQRSGLLTRAGFLTVTGATDGSHPVKRGRRVYERLLCGVLPTPPADVPPAQGASSGGTTRERFQIHDNNPCTGGCHVVMDKLGFAFEHYDGIGKYRTTDNGGMVDSSGAIELDGANHPFKDARELSDILAKSPTVTTCFATQWLRYGFKRMETEADRASLQSVVAAFATNNSIVDMLVGVTGSRSFRYRAPATGEKLQ